MKLKFKIIQKNDFFKKFKNRFEKYYIKIKI